MFNSPRRRTVRQRSGFTVSGEKTGSESVISQSYIFDVDSNNLILSFENTDCQLEPQFKEGIGLAGFGGYLRIRNAIKLQASISIFDPLDHGSISSNTRSKKFEQNNWSKFGVSVRVEDASLYSTVNLQTKIHIQSQDDSLLGTVELFGINADTLKAYSGRDVLSDYGKKTYLYLPEIFYLQHDEAFILEPADIQGEVSDSYPGNQVVLKSCNRCTRFLMIDVEDERNALGFSNHCVKRAPCKHNSFSAYSIENISDIAEFAPEIIDMLEGEDGKQQIIRTHYGFQLECRPCKKFEVNAPLNPLRNQAQRREDGLRRRAFEQLLMQLLKKDWIFYKHRMSHNGKEFDTYIWNKFGQQCFGCGKALDNVSKMDLDHTMPLVYLYPLDDTATCLCSTCNSQKHDSFPFEFPKYQGRLEELANITGLDVNLLKSREKIANPVAVQKLRERVVWFFDDFLMESRYQKVRDGKKTADLILASLQRVLNETETGLNLLEAYIANTGNNPSSVTVNQKDS